MRSAKHLLSCVTGFDTIRSPWDKKRKQKSPEHWIYMGTVNPDENGQSAYFEC